jgi:hypothetical protein
MWANNGVSRQEGRFTPMAELAGAVLAMVLGLVVSRLLGTYPNNETSAVFYHLGDVSDFVIGYLIFFLLLARSGFRPLAYRGALWAMAVWYTAALGRMAYIGFFLVPVEMMLIVVALRVRCRMGYPRAFLIAIVGRISIWIIQYATDEAVYRLLQARLIPIR